MLEFATGSRRSVAVGVGLLVALVCTADAALAVRHGDRSVAAAGAASASLRLSAAKGTISVSATGAVTGSITSSRARGTWPNDAGTMLRVRQVCTLSFVGQDIGEDSFRGRGTVASFVLNYAHIEFVGQDLGRKPPKQGCGSSAVTTGPGGRGKLRVYIDDVIIGAAGERTIRFSRGQGRFVRAG